MNILICDDNEPLLKMLKNKIINCTKNSHNIVYIDSKERLSDVLCEATQFDVLIEDICLDNNKLNSDGINVACSVMEKYPKIKTIFISGFDCFFEDIFIKIKPYAFIKKPINFELLALHLNAIEDELNTVKNESFFVKNKSINRSFSYDEILFFESRGRTVILHTENEKILIYSKLSDIENQAPKCFFRCHQSYLVNASHVRGNVFDNSYIIVSNNTRLPVSRSHLKSSKDILLKTMGGLL